MVTCRRVGGVEKELVRGVFCLRAGMRRWSWSFLREQYGG